MTTSLYCGIDLHSNNCVVSIEDKNSKQAYEKRLPHLYG
jgi:transposase